MKKKVCIALTICMLITCIAVPGIGSEGTETPDVEETVIIEDGNAEVPGAPAEDPEEEPEEQPEEEPEKQPEEEPEEEPEEVSEEEPEEEPEKEPEENPEEVPVEKLEEKLEESPEETLKEEHDDSNGETASKQGNNETDGETDSKAGDAVSNVETEGKESNDKASGETYDKDNDSDPSEVSETNNNGETDKKDIVSPEASTDEMIQEVELLTEETEEGVTENQEIEMVVDGPSEETAEEPADFEIDEEGTLTIREGVTVIGKELFIKNSDIKKVIVPASVEEIQARAFKGCTNLETIEITVGNQLTISEEAFAECTKLNSVTINSGDELQIGSKAFAECTSLVAVEITTQNGEVVFLNTENYEGDSTEIAGIVVAVDAFYHVKEEEWEDIDWDDIDIDFDFDWSSISFAGGNTTKKTTTKKNVRHVKGRTKTTHDYDQVQIIGGETEPMTELKIGEDTLALSLKDAEGEAAEFTAAFATGAETWDGTEQDADAVDTLILKTVKTEGQEWAMNGTVLRQLNKSGIEWLIFLCDETSVTVPTEGFLAGWEYDELKRQGTAGRRFEYRMAPTEEGASWHVTIEGKEYALDEDPMAPIYLIGIETQSGKERAAQRAETENSPETTGPEAGNITGNAIP